MPPLDIASTDFELFDTEPRFRQDRAALDARWLALQTEVHPDRFAAQGAAAQRVAMQWSVRINEAYQRLRDPVRRATYLCELNGAPLNTESNTAMPPDFLVQQMHWRESLDEVGDAAGIEQLRDEVEAARARSLSSLDSLIDDKNDYPAAALQVRALMFIERFAHDIEMKADALGQ